MQVSLCLNHCRYPIVKRRWTMMEGDRNLISPRNESIPITCLVCVRQRQQYQTILLKKRESPITKFPMPKEKSKKQSDDAKTPLTIDYTPIKILRTDVGLLVLVTTATELMLTGLRANIPTTTTAV